MKTTALVNDMKNFADYLDKYYQGYEFIILVKDEKTATELSEFDFMSNFKDKVNLASLLNEIVKEILKIKVLEN